MGAVMNCDLSEYKGKYGSNFYHSNIVLYPHYFTMNNFSKYHTNNNYNEKCWGYAITSSRAESIETKCVAIKNGLTMFNFVGCNVVTQKASKNKHNYLHHNFKIWWPHTHFENAVFWDGALQWMQKVPPKHQWISTRLLHATSEMT